MLPNSILNLPEPSFHACFIDCQVDAALADCIDRRVAFELIEFEIAQSKNEIIRSSVLTLRVILLLRLESVSLKPVGVRSQSKGDPTPIVLIERVVSPRFAVGQRRVAFASAVRLLWCALLSLFKCQSIPRCSQTLRPLQKLCVRRDPSRHDS